MGREVGSGRFSYMVMSDGSVRTREPEPKVEVKQLEAKWLPDLFHDSRPPVIRAVDLLAYVGLFVSLAGIVGYALFCLFTWITLVQGLVGCAIAVPLLSFFWIIAREDGSI